MIESTNNYIYRSYEMHYVIFKACCKLTKKKAQTADAIRMNIVTINMKIQDMFRIKMRH